MLVPTGGGGRRPANRSNQSRRVKGRPDGGTIHPDGGTIHPAFPFEVKTPAESKYPRDYCKLVATIPADEAFRPPAQSEGPLV
jgi:hypothetical protein